MIVQRIACLLSMIGMALLYGKLSPGWAGLLLVANAVSMGAYALDKAQAQKGGFRISELVLHALAVPGAAGACLGRTLFHHKTLKPAFGVSTWLGTAVTWGAVFLLRT